MAVLSLLVAGVADVESQVSLFVTAGSDKPSYLPGETITVSGRVSDGTGNGVPDASVSVQVNNPTGQIIHVGLVFSGADGRYTDQFVLSSTAPLGSYSISVTASKTGFNPATTTSSYVVVNEFLLVTYSSILALLVALSILRRVKR